MNNSGAPWMRRAVGITLLLTFVFGSGIVVWGMAFTPSRQASTVEPEPILIAPVSSTQPGLESEGSTIPSEHHGATPHPSAAPTHAHVAATPQATKAPGSTAPAAPAATAAPTAAPTPAPACGTGGVCTHADIHGHNTAHDCRAAINVGGTINAYGITESFLNSHKGNFKNIEHIICGKVYTDDLKQAVSNHQNGSTHMGAVFQQWINNFYLGPYQ